MRQGWGRSRGGFLSRLDVDIEEIDGEQTEESSEIAVLVDSDPKGGFGELWDRRRGRLREQGGLDGMKAGGSTRGKGGEALATFKSKVEIGSRQRECKMDRFGGHRGETTHHEGSSKMLLFLDKRRNRAKEKEERRGDLRKISERKSWRRDPKK